MEVSIFQEIQERYNILDVAKSLNIRLKKVGSSYRSDSLDGDGGENALAFYEDSNSWYDFKLGIGGDVTALVAHAKFNGSMKDAIHDLLPGRENYRISKELQAKKDFMSNIELWHKNLFKADRKPSVEALNYLHNRGINDNTIRDLKIGIDFQMSEYRLVIPYWDEAGKNVLYFTSRRLDDSNEKSPKYKKASLEQFPFLRNAPMGLNSLKREKKDVLVITEGVFDWLAFYQEGYSVLSPNGGDFGKQWEEVLEKIKGFRRVLLAFDNDAAGQGFTYKAAQELIKHKIPFSCANLLTKDVAEHYELTHNLDAIFNSARSGNKWLLSYITPKVPFEELTVGEKEKAMDKCKKFIDDIAAFTNASEIHDMLINLRAYFPKDWISGLLEIARKGPAQADVAEKIRLSHDLLYNPRVGFFEYQDPAKHGIEKGIWKQLDPENVMSYINARLGRFATGSKLTSILKLVQTDMNILSDTPLYEFNSLPLVSFLNGTLHIDMKTGKGILKPHSRYDYTTVQLPYYYDPDAKCPKWEKFIDEITNERKDNQAVLQEFSGYVLNPDCKFQKALMLKGGGSNGKSVFFDIISAALGGLGKDGKGYIAGSEPSKWANDFRLMSMRTAWLNISRDMENDFRGAEGVFKKIVAGEVLEDSYKFKDNITFETRTKLMMACNFFPTINDTSDGFMRRWLIVELPMHYVAKGTVRPGTYDRELDPYLEDKLMKELPGIFNWILAGLQRLLKQKGFTHTKQQDALIREFRAANNPLYSFVEEKCEYFSGSDEGHIVPRQTVFSMFAEWAENNRIFPMPANRFYSNMKSVFNNLSMPFDEDYDNWIFYFQEALPDGSEVA